MEQRQSPHPRWDEEVCERLVAGDEAALRELYDEFSPLVYGLAARVTRDWAAAVSDPEETAVAGSVAKSVQAAVDDLPVEDHLAGCPSCAAEADRLGRVAAGLATTVAAPPPARLRDAVLAAAVARRPAAGEEASTGYAAWVERFDTLLERLTPAQWRARVIHDLTVQDLVAHLIATDELLVAQLDAETSEDPAELDGTLPARRGAASIGEHRGRPPERTRAAVTTLGCD